MKDKDFLEWIYSRLKNVHGENPNVDYMHKLRAVCKSTDPGKETLTILNETNVPGKIYVRGEKWQTKL